MIINGNSITHYLSLFDAFLNVFVIGLDTYSSRFRDMFLVVGILRIQMRSLESVYGVSMFSEVLTKSLKFY